MAFDLKFSEVSNTKYLHTKVEHETRLITIYNLSNISDKHLLKVPYTFVHNVKYT